MKTEKIRKARATKKVAELINEKGHRIRCVLDLQNQMLVFRRHKSRRTSKIPLVDVYYESLGQLRFRYPEREME